MSEQLYDEEIAPMLFSACKKAEELGMAFVACVEFDVDCRARTEFLPASSSLAMRMIQHCIKTAPNLDGFVIGILRYCRKEGIKTDQSIIANRFAQ